MILSLENVDVRYGQSHVLYGINLGVDEGKIVALLGRNGVGKTTMMRSIIGLTPPSAGKILFKGKDIARHPAYTIARQGIGYVPQGREIIPNLTVKENLLLGTIIRNGKIGTIPEEIFDYFPILKERLDQKGGTMSGGQQQMLAIGRAIAGNPSLLLLDEPSEGIQPSIVEQLRDVIKQLNVERGLSILLVEQNTEFAFGIADKCYVLDKGHICDEGTVDEIRDDEIIRKYLAL